MDVQHRGRRDDPDEALLCVDHRIHHGLGHADRLQRGDLAKLVHEILLEIDRMRSEEVGPDELTQTSSARPLGTVTAPAAMAAEQQPDKP